METKEYVVLLFQNAQLTSCTIRYKLLLQQSILPITINVCNITGYATEIKLVL